MNQSPPEMEQPSHDLFPQRPIRSEFERAPSYRARRFFTIVILLGALGGLGYHFWPLHTAPSGEIPIIKADANNFKQKPDQPGGIDIPHQDVQVYEAIDGKDPEKPEVEHLLPPPETPQTNTAPAVSTNAAPSPPVMQTENLTPSKSEAPPLLEPPPPPVVQTTVDTHPAASAATAVVTPPPVVAPAPPPAAAVVKAAPAPATIVAKPKATAAQSSSSKGGKANRAIQLASVQDENAAHDMMGKLQNQYASVLGDAHLHLVKADLGGKGIFYRIRSTPLTEDQATRMCDSIKRMKAGCILVH